MNKFFLIAACVTISSAGFATTYNSEDSVKHPVVAAYAEFTPETLHEHAQPVSPATAAWLERHKQLLGLLVMLPASLSNWVRYWQLAHEELALHNLENISRCNYVVKFIADRAEQPQVFKIAGPLNRIAQIKSAHDYYSTVVVPLAEYMREIRERAKRCNEPLVPENFKRLAKLFDPHIITIEELNNLEKVDTYQTASRLPVYLVCQKIIDQRNLEKVIVPPITLVNMSDPKQNSTDDYSVIIQEWADDVEEITAENRDAISNQAVKELTILICNAGLWSLDLLLRKDGALVLVDTEQPNNEKPQNAFYNWGLKVNWNVREGLVSFAQLFKYDTEKIELIIETARQEGALARLEETHTINSVKALEAELENLKKSSGLA